MSKVKYDLFFRLSFISYVLIIIARPYVTVQIWADIVLVLFIMALVYQFIYMFFLRKKENKKFSNVFLKFLLYGITSISIYIIIEYINDFINGFTPTDLLGNSTGSTYYGIQAILKNGWKNLFSVPYLILNLLFIIVYHKLANKTQKETGKIMMKNKVVIKRLIIISVIILVVGALLGIGVRTIMLDSLTKSNLPAENIAGIGADYSGIIGLFGNIFITYIGVRIFVISVIIDFIIWIVYGIVRFVEKRKNESS